MPLHTLKNAKRALIQAYASPADALGLWQALSTLVLCGLCWVVMVWSASAWPLALPFLIMALSLLLLRVFVLMHECGHGSLFLSPHLNRWFGVVFGVLAGMPQFVWSKHHAYHHSTNGNWAKYRGPLAVITVDAYLGYTPQQQKRYQRARSIFFAPIAGLMYLLINPRLNWLKGSVQWLAYMVKQKWQSPRRPFADIAASFTTPYWESAQAYRHMLLNNVLLFVFWGGMMAWMGIGLFALCYLISMALSGAGGLLLFIVQHNFEDAYASADDGWDYDQAALEGTSFLVLPAWLNWVTANIGYHHIHHLSARIPNYRLAACHHENAHLFADVPQMRISQIPAALKCILWDEAARKICTVASIGKPS